MKKSRTSLLGGSLRNKLLLYFLGIALIPFAISGYIGYNTIVTEAQDSAKREMKSIAQSASGSVNVFMNDRVSDVLVWADLRLIKEALEVAEVREDASETMREMVKLYGSYEGIFLLDAKGNCVSSSWPASVGTDFSAQEGFKGARGGKLHIVDFHTSKLVEQIDPASKGWTAAIAAPVKIGGNVTGVVLAYLKWAPLQAILDAIPVGTTGYVWVVTKNNKLMLHPGQTPLRRGRKRGQNQIAASG